MEDRLFLSFYFMTWYLLNNKKQETDVLGTFYFILKYCDCSIISFLMLFSHNFTAILIIMNVA